MFYKGVKTNTPNIKIILYLYFSYCSFLLIRYSNRFTQNWINCFANFRLMYTISKFIRRNTFCIRMLFSNLIQKRCTCIYFVIHLQLLKIDIFMTFCVYEDKQEKSLKMKVEYNSDRFLQISRERQNVNAIVYHQIIKTFKITSRSLLRSNIKWIHC